MEHARNPRQPTAVLTDEEIIRRILLGEKELYELLLQRYNQTIFRTIRSYLAEEDVEDTMQDAYVKAYEKLNTFQFQSAFSTWLIKIAINEALQVIRKKKRSRIIRLHEPPTDSESGNPATGVAPVNPEKKILHQEAMVLLETSISQLPEKYRIIYILREIEGMPNPEISACLDLSESNVKVRLHRARQLLRDMLLSGTRDVPVFEFGNQRCERMVKRVMERINVLYG